jgi:hypothetical protein
MKELKAIVTCTVPFIVAAVLLYPFMAIVGANFDPFMWERTDRMFYFICTALFGWALFMRVDFARKESV